MKTIRVNVTAEDIAAAGDPFFFELTLPDWLCALVDEAIDEDEPRCRVCGCTQARACEGGCSWVPTNEEAEVVLGLLPGAVMTYDHRVYVTWGKPNECATCGRAVVWVCAGVRAPHLRHAPQAQP